jgi:N-terminal acetyltransferase B complex non-catalytic subunit
LIQARQDGYKSNKRVAFALVLANQLTYEAYTELAQRQHRDITRAEKLQGDLALRQMQTAFSGPTSTQGDLIRVQDMRDLKFMGDIFVRHDRLSELWRLWDSGNAPQAMVDLMSKNYEDLITIRLSLVKGSKTIDWSEHRDYCIRTVSRAMESSDPATSLTELSTRSWHVWKHLIEATARLVTAAELPEQT